MAKHVSRNRVHGDRLWDDQGCVWTCGGATWATTQDVDHLLRRGGRIVVHGFGRPMVWIPPDRGQAYWTSIRQHMESREAAHGPEPDAEGLTYIARIWRSGDDSLLGFEACC